MWDLLVIDVTIMTTGTHCTQILAYIKMLYPLIVTACI